VKVGERERSEDRGSIGRAEHLRTYQYWDAGVFDISSPLAPTSGNLERERKREMKRQGMREIGLVKVDKVKAAGTSRRHFNPKSPDPASRAPEESNGTRQERSSGRYEIRLSHALSHSYSPLSIYTTHRYAYIPNCVRAVTDNILFCLLIQYLSAGDYQASRRDNAV